MLKFVEEREKYLDEGRRPDGSDNPVKVHGVKRKSSLFHLFY